MKKIGLFLPLLVFLTGSATGEEVRFQLALQGGIAHILEYGSEQDYVQGENDFPVTPAHTPPAFGLSFSYFIAEKIKLELDWRYAVPSSITLADPSDGDAVEIKTGAQSFTTLNFCYQCIRCNFRPYLLVGGGVNRIHMKEKTYTTEYGYKIGVAAPDRKSVLMAQLGWGLDVALRPALGVRMDVRFVYVFVKPDNIPLLFVGFGMYYLF